jgi:redox-sensing transcriptional repressor
MSRYRRLLLSLQYAGVLSIYSHQLARHAGVSAAQVRRDLMAIGYSGSPNKGYDVAACIESIGSFLDGPGRQEAVLVGVGNLGRAVLEHADEAGPALGLVAAFDIDPALEGTSVNGCRVLPAARMEAIVRDLGIRIAVLTVPASSAQDVADALVRAGVQSIVSFAPVPLHLPNDVFVEYMDITAAMESAAYFARLGGRGAAEADGEGNGNGNGEIEPIVKRLQSLLSRSHMRLEDLAQNIGARIVTPGKSDGTEVTKIYAGDRVSDLLNEASESTLLVSNLASVQMLRVAELMDVPGICFVNGVEPDGDVVGLARQNGTLLMVAPAGVFETCGLIYQYLSGERRS